MHVHKAASVKVFHATEQLRTDSRAETYVLVTNTRHSGILLQLFPLADVTDLLTVHTPTTGSTVETLMFENKNGLIVIKLKTVRLRTQTITQ